MLWFYECMWIYEMQEIAKDKEQKEDHSSFDNLDEYLNYGLAEFEKMDDIPISLKALLFCFGCP